MRRLFTPFLLALILPFSAEASTYTGQLNGTIACSVAAEIPVAPIPIKGWIVTVVMPDPDWGFDGLISVENLGSFSFAVYDRSYDPKGEAFSATWVDDEFAPASEVDSPVIGISGTAKKGKMRGVLHAHNIFEGCFMTGTIK